jgi:hypothetical protein
VSGRSTDVQVVPYGSATSQRKPYTVSLVKAEVMVARGVARWLGDGTRRIQEVRTAARGSLRSWRKVTNRSRSGAALYSSMQLVPGVSQGRNTGGKRSLLSTSGTGRVVPVP